MKPSTPRDQPGRVFVGQIVLALLAALLVVGLATGPARSEDKGRGDHHQGHNQQTQWAHHPAPRGHEYYQRAPQSYGYYAPPLGYYAPPPVVYVPPPSPGISLFFGFPIQIH